MKTKKSSPKRVCDFLKTGPLLTSKDGYFLVKFRDSEVSKYELGVFFENYGIQNVQNPKYEILNFFWFEFGDSRSWKRKKVVQNESVLFWKPASLLTSKDEYFLVKFRDSEVSKYELGVFFENYGIQNVQNPKFEFLNFFWSGFGDSRSWKRKKIVQNESVIF